MDFSFDSIKIFLKEKLSLLSNWQKILYHSVYERIFDAIAYALERVIYVTEILYREAVLKTAQRRESLVNMSTILSYIPYRKKGAVGYVELSADPNFDSIFQYTGKSVNIEKWKIFTNDDKDVKVYCIETVNYETNYTGNFNIPVKEGVPKTFIYIASGNSNEIITIYGDDIDNDEIEIFRVDENDVVLEQIYICGINEEAPERIYFVTDTVYLYCEIENANDFNSVIFTFGDGISSRALEAGNRILIKYASTNGDKGNITSAGVISRYDGNLIDSQGNVVELFVRNTEEISDGSDIEDIESIRQNAPYLFAAGYRAGSYKDWVAIINSLSFVYKSSVWSIEDLGGSTLMAEQNTVYVTAISSDGNELTTAQKQNIEANYLEDKKSPTEVVSWETLEKIHIKFEINAKIKNKTIPVMQQNIKDVLYNKYGILNTDFQKNAYESNFINHIDDIEDLIEHTTEAYFMEEDMSANLSNHIILPSYVTEDTDILDDQIWIEYESVEVWLKRKVDGEWLEPFQIGRTVGSVITGESGYTIVGGSISYITNSVSFIVQNIINDVGGVVYGIRNPGVEDDLGFVINVTYKCRDGNGDQTNSIRMPYFYQITDIDPDYIFIDLEYE